MIYTLARNVADALHARHFPVLVQYGPDRVRPEHGGNGSGVVVFARDRAGGDGITGPAGNMGANPKLAAVRGVGVVVDVFARSSLAGARANEHEWLCDTFVDGLVVALTEWATASKAGALAWIEARYLTPEEQAAAGLDFGDGAAYRLRFRVSRGTLVRTFEGEAQPTGTVAGVRTTQVSVSVGNGAAEVVPLGGI